MGVSPVGNPVSLSQLDLDGLPVVIGTSWESRFSLPTRLVAIQWQLVESLGIPFLSPN